MQTIPDEHLHVRGEARELQAWVEITRERDPTNASEIEAWIGRIGGAYDVLPLDGPCFRAWARLMHRRPDDLVTDALVAATAVGSQSRRRDPQRSGFPAARGSATLNPWRPGSG